MSLYKRIIWGLPMTKGDELMFGNDIKRQTKAENLKESSKVIVETNSPITEEGHIVEYLALPGAERKLYPMIEIGSSIPMQKEYTFSTMENEQDEIILRLCRGKNLEYSEMFYLGGFQVRGISKLPAGKPSIQVTFFIDFNQISISARDLTTMKYMEIQRIKEN